MLFFAILNDVAKHQVRYPGLILPFDFNVHVPTGGISSNNLTSYHDC